MQDILYLTALLAIGQILKTQKSSLGDLSLGLNNFIIYVSLPSLILLNIPKIEFEYQLLSLVVIPWMMVPISALAAIWITKNSPRDIRYALLILLPLGNTSFVVDFTL